MSVGAKQSVPIQGGSQIFRQSLKDCWIENVLCDVVLISKIDAKRISAHRIVLAAASDYFKAMFTGKMKESVEKEITLELRGNVLEVLVKYFYSDVIDLDEEYAKELYAAAHLMQLDKVVTECSEFLLNNLNSTNCFELLFFAEKNEYDLLLEKNQTFILNEFETIYEGTGFLEVDFDYLLNLLQNALMLRDEKVVFLAVQRWINQNAKREIHKDALMEHVHFHELKPEFLFEVVASFYNTEKAYKAYSMALAKMDVDNTLLAVGADASNTGCLQIEAFHSRADKWYKLKTDIPWRKNFGMTKMGANIIIAAGRDNNCDLNTVISLDLETLDWKYLPPMIRETCFCSAVVCNGNLYAIGHFSEQDLFIECWDATANRWWTSTIIVGFCGTGVTVFNDSIYIVGYEKSRNVESRNFEIRRFDTLHSDLVFIASIGCIIWAYFIEFQDELYIFAMNGNIYCYNINENLLRKLPQMPIASSRVKQPAIFNNEIILGDLQTLIKYNAVTNVWTEFSHLNNNSITHVISCQFYWNKSKIIQE